MRTLRAPSAGRRRALHPLDRLRVTAGVGLLEAGLCALYLWGDWVYVGIPQFFCAVLVPNVCAWTGPTHVSAPIFGGILIAPLLAVALLPLVACFDPRRVYRILGSVSVGVVAGIVLVRVYSPPLTHGSGSFDFTQPTLSPTAVIAPIVIVVAGILAITGLVRRSPDPSGSRPGSHTVLSGRWSSPLTGRGLEPRDPRPGK
jgi:hypothetical protein